VEIYNNLHRSKILRKLLEEKEIICKKNYKTENVENVVEVQSGNKMIHYVKRTAHYVEFPKILD